MELTERVMEFAAELTAMSALPIRVMKESTYTSTIRNLIDVLHKEAVYQSEYVQEEIKAILETKYAAFSGRIMERESF